MRTAVSVCPSICLSSLPPFLFFFSLKSHTHVCFLYIDTYLYVYVRINKNYKQILQIYFWKKEY
jgi:hypothetical protein